MEYDPWDCICFEKSNEGQGQGQERPHGHKGKEGRLSAAYLIMIIVKKQGCSEELVGMSRRRLRDSHSFGIPSNIPLHFTSVVTREGFQPSFKSPSDLKHLKR